METMQTLKVKVFMQYVLEFLIEQYENAQKESDRYYVQLEFLDFIETCRDDFNVFLDYMELQPEKFEPFIRLLKRVKPSMQSKKSMMPINVPAKSKVFVINIGE